MVKDLDLDQLGIIFGPKISLLDKTKIVQNNLGLKNPTTLKDLSSPIDFVGKAIFPSFQMYPEKWEA